MILLKWMMQYLQGTESIKNCGGKVRLQCSHTGIFQGKQEVQVESVLLTGNLQKHRQNN